jgi:hypothetical protein
MSQTLTLHFHPPLSSEYKYYYDAIKVHAAGENNNLLVPIHAYPVLSAGAGAAAATTSSRSGMNVKQSSRSSSRSRSKGPAAAAKALFPSRIDLGNCKVGER